MSEPRQRSRSTSSSAPQNSNHKIRIRCKLNRGFGDSYFTKSPVFLSLAVSGPIQVIIKKQTCNHFNLIPNQAGDTTR
jgi:hypothetical protein